MIGVITASYLLSPLMPLIIFALVFFVIFLVGSELLHRRTRKIAAQRRTEGRSLATFTEYFSGEQIDQAVLRTVYEYLEQWNGGDFPVLPGDDISDFYGIVNEDIDDRILELARISGCRTPTPESCKRWLPIKSVEDLVRLLQVHKAPAESEHQRDNQME